MKDILKPGIILLLITIVSVGFLAFVNEVTTEPILAQEIESEKSANQVVLEEADNFDIDNVLEEDKSFEGSDIIKVTKGYKNSELYGYAIMLETNGFGGDLRILVGVDLNGVVKGIEVLSHSETPGLGAVADTDEFKLGVKDKKTPVEISKSADTNENEISAITGATITSKAVADSINEAAEWVVNGGGQ